jgi:hypothetical protein
MTEHRLEQLPCGCDLRRDEHGYLARPCAHHDGAEDMARLLMLARDVDRLNRLEMERCFLELQAWCALERKGA